MFLPSVSRAESLEPSASEKETARSLMREGDAHFEAGRFQEALEAYRAADAIMKVPTTGLAAGKAAERLGLLLEARDAWLSVLRYPQAAGEPAPFVAARQEASALARAIADRIPSLRVNVQGVASDTQVAVRVDGREVRVAHVENKVNPGAHRIDVSADGFRSQSIDVQLVEGERRGVDVRLEPLATSEAVAAIPPAPSSSETHDRASRAPGERDRTAMWIGFGVGAVGVSVGSVFGTLSLLQTAELKDDCPENRCPPELEDEIDGATLQANIANVGFVVGALGVGFGLWQLWGEDAEQVSSTPELRVSPGGVTLDGRF